MSGKQFTEWMKRNRVRVSEVAADTKLDTNTVYAFRRGVSVRRTTVDILLRFVSEFEARRSIKRAAS